METRVGLDGDSSAERLTVHKDKIVVESPGRGGPREWNLDKLDGFRLDSTIGSCFLQAQVDGRWIDLLRYPGDTDPRLTALLDHLNARRRLGRWPDEGDPDSEDQKTVLSRWLSGPDEIRPKTQRWRTAGRLLGLMRPFRGTIALMLALSVVAVSIEVAPPMLQRALVDGVLQTGYPESRGGQVLLLLGAIVAGLLFIRVAATLVAIWKARISSRVGTALTANLREELVKKLNELPLAFHDRNQVGMLMSRVAYDTETLHTLLHHITGGLLLQVLQLTGIGVMLFYLNPKLALVTMLPMPLILAGGWYFTRYLNPRHQHYWEAVGKQASSLMGMLSGIRVVKAFVQEDREIGRFSDSSHRLRDSRQTVDISTATFTAIMGFLFALGTLAVWYLGGHDVLFDTMSLGSLMAFLAYLAMFYTPLTSVAESTTWFSGFFTASRRIFDLLETPSESEEPGDGRALRRVEGRVKFQEVVFGYTKNRPVLKDIDFTIEPGEMVGVVGRSGSGKSTLVSLIGRLYEVDSGRILIDGADVRDLDARQLRRQIGMVPQEPFLFRGAIAENVAYGNSGATAEQILRAAKQADAHDFIMRKPLAYETQLGEGGSGLSGGERQRLSIARALLYDPAILILDEATASVDAESERAICNAIRRFSRRRTTIVIAHRLSTLRDADRLLVFDLGRLIEQGTHEELIAQGGLYSTLVRLQSNLHESRRRVESVVGSHTSPNGNGSVAEVVNDKNFFDAFPVGDESAGDSGSRNGRIARRQDDGDPHWIEPATAAIEADEHGLLQVTVGEREYGDVHAVRTFPASHERAFISLRKRDATGGETEVGIVRNLDDWPKCAQEAILRSLTRRYLLRRIHEFRSIRTSGSLLTLSVTTDTGPVRLELEKPGDGFPSFGERGLLLIDALGNYYVVPDRNALPKHQRRLLDLYLGD